MSRPADRAPARTPTLRGAACVLVYSAALVAVTLVGFASLPRRVERPLQRPFLDAAAWSAARVDWAAHDWVDRFRRWLGTRGWLRAFTRAVLDDAISATDEAAGYVATVHPPAGDGGVVEGGSERRHGDGDERDPAAWLERALAHEGFHRNPAAYLEYREREGREYERSSWLFQSSVYDDHQLHVRLFENRDGTLDVYGHWEPAVAAGGDHYGRPDYRTGVAMMLGVLDRMGVPFERRDSVGGVTPEPVALDAEPPRPGPDATGRREPTAADD